MAEPARVLTEPDAVGQRIRAALEALMGSRRVTRAQIARSLGKEPQWLYDRLHGNVRLAVEEVAQIAEVLGVSFQDVVELSTHAQLTQGFTLPGYCALLPEPALDEAEQLELRLSRPRLSSV